MAAMHAAPAGDPEMGQSPKKWEPRPPYTPKHPGKETQQQGKPISLGKGKSLGKQ